MSSLTLHQSIHAMIVKIVLEEQILFREWHIKTPASGVVVRNGQWVGRYVGIYVKSSPLRQKLLSGLQKVRKCFTEASIELMKYYFCPHILSVGFPLHFCLPIYVNQKCLMHVYLIFATRGCSFYFI